MKKVILLFSLLLAAVAMVPLHADIVINGVAYHADTLQRRQVAPGTISTIVRLPDYPLNIYLIESDMNNPYNRVETTFGRGTLGYTELLSDACARHRTPTKRPLVACNANFWIVTGSSAPLVASQMGFPMGGVVRNDTTIVNDNNTVDQWCGGPMNTGVAAITPDKRLVMGHVGWEGTITSSRLAGPVTYHNLNRRAVRGEICLYNRAYGNGRAFEDDWVSFNTRGDNQTDNYFLTFVTIDSVKEVWKTNSPMKFVVNRIEKGQDRLHLGYSNACIAVTGDANKAVMAALQVGDTIEVTSGFHALDASQPEPYPTIENLVTGQATLIQDGEITSRNFNDDYNTPYYSRTIYGTNGDGSRLYMLVIDMSTSPKYGLSRGCPTVDACQVMQAVWPDIQMAVNMDAGGSAEMFIDGKIVNTTTEGNPRGVACGWMIEAIGEEDHEVASIAFDKFRIDIAEYSMTTPRILGYNRLGELVDEDVKGFTLSCDPSLGTTLRDSTFIAGGGDLRGTLTATLNGMTATVPVHVLPAQPGMVLQPILIDEREYPIELTSQIVNDTYFYDPSIFDWTLDNPEVATVTDGVLRGRVNGSTGIAYQVGPYSGSSTVNVEISDEPYRQESLAGWTFKGAGAKDITCDTETGDIHFTYSSNRAPYLQMSKDWVVYGLPDTIALVFNSTMPIEYVQIDTRNRMHTTTNYLKCKPEDGSETFATGVDHTLLIDLKKMGGADYVGTYPLNIKTIKFTLNKDGEVGEHTLSVKSFYCHYPDNGSGPGPQPLYGDVNNDGEVTVADINAIIDVILLGTSNAGADVNTDGEITIADINAVIDVILGH